MKICIASDHAGVDLKTSIAGFLKDLSFQVVDLGPFSIDSVDYPDYALQVANKVAANECQMGVLICGTGLGMSYTANKVKGIRAALCTNEFMARMAKEHNDANILVLGARVVGLDLALSITHVFFTTAFTKNERHIKRINKITNIEKSC
jgi:ribose 5-phosphate isomerase B